MLMAKVVVPIVQLHYPSDTTFPLEILEALASHPGYQAQEDYTFTFRFSVPTDDDSPGAREQATLTLRQTLPPAHASKLIDLLNANDWDVSFFVDTF